MKKYYITAVIISTVNLATHPIMKQLAYLERGYQAHGGETLLFIFGFISAFMVVYRGWEKTRHHKEQYMKYIVCPTCGAHLDHGERCYDCEIKKGNLPKSKPPYTESEQSENHFDANLNISCVNKICQ